MYPDRPHTRPSARLLVPVALLHVVCCCGLILWLLIGSTGVAALGSYLGDPLIQAVGILTAGGVGIAIWRRYRIRRTAAVTSLPGSPDQSSSMLDGSKPQ